MDKSLSLPQPTPAKKAGEDTPAKEPPHALSVGFILLPHFTLLPFAAFIDALRLAADEGDQSRQIRCHWTVMGQNSDLVTSSCGVSIKPWESYPDHDPSDFDYLVIAGGLLHQGEVVNKDLINYLHQADKAHTPLVGLCTGSFALVRAGLMEGRRCCVSWFHYRDLTDQFSNVTPVADQLFIDDGDRITSAGGPAAADLAAHLIEKHLGKRWARESLRILVMNSPRPGTTPQPQPQPAEQLTVNNKLVERSLLILEQNMSKPLSTDEIATRLNISRRQLERLFISETGQSLQKFYRHIRLQYGKWFLSNTTRTITDIALECGFSDSAHFSRTFQTEFGIKPSEYRAQKQEETKE